MARNEYRVEITLMGDPIFETSDTVEYARCSAYDADHAARLVKDMMGDGWTVTGVFQQVKFSVDGE